jgi:hypothetical protein
MAILPELRARGAGLPVDAEIIWYHPAFCHVSLPPEPGGTGPWHRSLSGTTVSIEPGGDPDRLPGGRLLRRLLMHLCDSALRAGQNQVTLGDRAAALAAAMNPPVAPADVAELEAQVAALLGCRITVATEGGPGLSVLDARGRPRAVAAEWRPVLRLNARFLDNLGRDKVALDREVVAALQGSALALDIYAWLAAAKPDQQEAVLAESWPELQARFGAPGQDAESFQAAFTAALALLRAALPGLDADDDAIGVGFSARTAAEPAPEPEPPAAPAPQAIEPPAPEPRAEQPRPEQPRSDQPRFDQPRSDRSRHEGSRHEGQRHEGLRRDGPRPETPRHETPRHEAPRPEAERPEAPRPEPVRADMPRSDQPRPDHPRPDRPRFDAPRDEPRDPQPRDSQPGQPMRQTISLRSHITGLQQVVWLQRANGRDNVIIEVTPGSRYDPNLATVLTLEPIVLQIAGGLHARDFERVSSWAAANRDLIDAFWEGEIDGFEEIISRVRKVPAPGLDRWRA